MKANFSFKVQTEIKNENLKRAGFSPIMLHTILMCGFGSELNNDDFIEEYMDEFDDLEYASMQDFSSIEQYIVDEIGEDRFQEIFGDQCTFYDDICSELRRWLTPKQLEVYWVPGYEGMYVVIGSDYCDDEIEDDEDSKNFSVWYFEGGEDDTDFDDIFMGTDSFEDYDDAVAYADNFVKGCDILREFVDDGNYIWNLKKGERIAIVRNYDNEDIYMTDICKAKAQ